MKRKSIEALAFTAIASFKSSTARREYVFRRSFCLKISSYRDTIESDMENRVFQKLIIIVAWTVLAFIAYETISPIQYRPTLPIPSSFERLVAFAVLGSLFCAAYPRYMVF